VILISLYIIFTLFSDLEVVVLNIQEIGKQELAIAVGLFLVTAGLRAIRWHFFLKWLGIQIPFRRNLIYYLAGYAFVISPGRVGEIVRSPFIKRDYGISVSKTASVTLVERFYDITAITLIISVGLSFSDFNKTLVIIPVGLVVAMLCIITSKRWLSKILVKLSKIGIFSKLVPNVDEVFTVFSSMLKTRYFVTGIAVSTINGILEATAVFLIILGLGYNIDFTDLTVLFHTSSFAANISLVPGGLGVLEGGLIGLLILYNIKYEVALSTVILIRVISTGMFSAIGAFCLNIISKR
jgi:uncharacterized protein (TIRG00374 family)